MQAVDGAREVNRQRERERDRKTVSTQIAHRCIVSKILYKIVANGRRRVRGKNINNKILAAECVFM